MRIWTANENIAWVMIRYKYEYWCALENIAENCQFKLANGAKRKYKTRESERKKEKWSRWLVMVNWETVGPKWTRSSAVAVIADRTACKFAVRTPLRVHCSRHSEVSAHVSALAANGTVLTRGPTNAVTCVLRLRCASFFVVHFVAKRYILEQKCQKGQIGTLMLGTCWYNF